jgi:hypothetical protein
VSERREGRADSRLAMRPPASGSASGRFSETTSSTSGVDVPSVGSTNRYAKCSTFVVLPKMISAVDRMMIRYSSLVASTTTSSIGVELKSSGISQASTTPSIWPPAFVEYIVTKPDENAMCPPDPPMPLPSMRTDALLVVALRAATSKVTKEASESCVESGAPKEPLRDPVTDVAGPVGSRSLRAVSCPSRACPPIVGFSRVNDTGEESRASIRSNAPLAPSIHTRKSAGSSSSADEIALPSAGAGSSVRSAHATTKRPVDTMQPSRVAVRRAPRSLEILPVGPRRVCPQDRRRDRVRVVHAGDSVLSRLRR